MSRFSDSSDDWVAGYYEFRRNLARDMGIETTELDAALKLQAEAEENKALTTDGCICENCECEPNL